MTVMFFLALYNPGSKNTDDEEKTNQTDDVNVSKQDTDKNGNSEVFDTASDAIVEVSDINNESSEDVSDNSDISEQTSDDISAAISEEPENKEPYHGWVINSHGYTYLYGGMGFEQFNYKNSALDRYVKCLNNIVDIFPEIEKVYNIVAPVHAGYADIPREIYRNDNFFNASQSAFVTTAETKFSEKIKDIPIVGKIGRRYKNGEYLFFRTDRNWTANSAYYAYSEFCEAAGITPLSKNSFIKREYDGYLGNFYYATGSEDMKKNPDTVEYYFPNANTECSLTAYMNGRVYKDFRLSGNVSDDFDPYNVYVGTEAEYFEINTNSDSDKTLLIIGDSSAAPMLPFISGHYRKIIYVNPLYFKGQIKDIASEYSIDELLHICYATDAVSGNYVPDLNKACGVKADE